MVDELVKSLILLAPQAILGFMTRLAKLQELGLILMNLSPKLLDVAHKRLFTKPSMVDV